MIGLALNAWPREVATRDVADAYRTAALDGANMRLLVNELEILSVALDDRDVAQFWLLIDNAVGRAYAQAHLAALLELRKAWVSALLTASERHLAESPMPGELSIVLFAWAMAYTRTEVIASLSRWLECHPNSALEKLRGIDRIVHEGRWVNALPAFELVAEHPTVPAVLRGRLLAIVGQIWLYRMWRQDLCDEYFARARALAPGEAYVLHAHGERLLDDYALDEVEDHARLILERDPSSCEATVLLANSASKRLNFGTAEQLLRGAIEKNPGQILPYRHLVGMTSDPNSRPGLLAEVRELVERMISIEPTDAYALTLHAAWALYDRRERDVERQENVDAMATAWFERALALDPAQTDARVGLALLRVRRGKTDDAKRLLIGTLEQHPQPRVYWELIAMNEHDDPVTAISVCLRGADEYPPLAPWFRARGALLVWKREPEARAESERIILDQVAISRDEQVMLLAEHLTKEIVKASGQEAARSWCEQFRVAAGPAHTFRLENLFGELALEKGDNYNEALDHFERAVLLAPLVAKVHTNRARCLRLKREWGRSLQLIEQAPPRVRNEPEFRREMALLLNDEAVDRSGVGDYAAAVPLYERAVEQSPHDRILLTNLANAHERNVAAPCAVRIEQALTALRSALDVASTSELEGLRARIRRLKSEAFLVQSFNDVQSTTFPHAVTPIALEVARDLIPFVSAGTGLAEAFAKSIEGVRRAIDERFGVRIPGVRVRGNETDLPFGTYIAMLSEVPLVSGNVDAARHMVLAEPREFGTDIGAVPFEDPLTGRDVVTIPASKLTDVQLHHFETFGPGEIMARHLQAVIERNLSDFVGHQETFELLQTKAPEELARVREVADGLSDLTSVFRALVAERVPINDVAGIAQKYLELCRKGTNLVDIVEQVRALPEVRLRLFGNRDGVRQFKLDKDFSRFIAEGIHQDDPVPTLALTPEFCQQALSMVRNNVTDDAVLVVDTSSIRPFVRRLVELEFPELPVLTLLELSHERDLQLLHFKDGA